MPTMASMFQVISTSSLRIELRKGDRAAGWIADAANVRAWQALAELDPKVGLVQQPGFVSTWFTVYASEFIPWLFLGWDAQGRLCGVLPLARHRTRQEITHAGDIHAEYHGWLATPETEDEFVEGCLSMIKTSGAAPRAWRWNWLPPGTHIKALDAARLRRHGVHVRLRAQESLVWDLEDEARLASLLQTKSIKNQYNRYKKKGDFRMERITNLQRTRELLQVCASQSDFRHGAIHDVRPFAEDPLKATFFAARLESSATNHFTVLWCSDSPLAFHFGECDANVLVLGLTAYDPVESRNSPGKLHLIELARLLRSEGVKRIDLTPGDDAYKASFANASQRLYRPTFYFSWASAARADAAATIQRVARSLLARMGITPDRARSATVRLAALSAKVRRLTPHSVLRRVVGLLGEEHAYRQYRMNPCAVRPEGDATEDIGVQRYGDLLLYRGANPWLVPNEMLRTAQRRFAAGETIYTVVKDDELVHYGWVAHGGREHLLDRVEATIESPSGSVVLYDFFTHPKYRGQGLYRRCLQKILADAAQAGCTEAFIGVLEGNETSQHTIEKVGFRLHRVFYRKRRLWWERRGEQRMGDGLEDVVHVSS